MKRSLIPALRHDLDKKIVLLSGPRQAGKTTISKMLFEEFDYLNYDDAQQRLMLHQCIWDRKKPILILDELHKMKNWKRWLKGIYDTEGTRPRLFVTGSARLDTSRKAGDSLAGRFFLFRLHPLDVKEVVDMDPKAKPEQVLSRLLEVGGFPEPFFENEPNFYSRWRRSHLDVILRQDLPSIASIQNITELETLVQLLRSRVASPLSYSSLGQDLQVHDKSIKSWIQLLENLFVVFKISPYHHNIARALSKAPKCYFFDTAQVENDSGARFENLVACSLLKEIHFREDTKGENWKLHFIRTKEKREVDFFLLKNSKPALLVECKWSDDKVDPGFHKISQNFKNIPAIQLVRNLGREVTHPGGIEVRRAADWLAKMPF